MKLIRYFICALLLIGFTKHSFSQEYGPVKIKNQDIKIMKGKVLLIPEYDEKMVFCKVFIDPVTFKAFKNEKKVQDEYKRRWDSAIGASTFDFCSYEIKYFDRVKLEKEKDKNYILMYFDHDWYNNWYVYLAVTEPKYTVIATAPINGIDLANVQDIKTMMNMLTYSFINTFTYYGDDAKALFRGHEYKYRNFINEFSDTLKNKVFLIPLYDKERKNFKKHNEKAGEFIKLNWKISKFEMLPPLEYKKRVAEGRPNDYYIKSFNVNTDNSIMTYQYFAIMATKNNYMVHGFMGLQYYNVTNLKYFQINIEKWLFNFKDKKDREKYVWITIVPKEEKNKKSSSGKKGKAPKEIKQDTKKAPKEIKQDTKKEPKTSNPPKTNKPVNKSKK
jgi:hypothetical protein